MFAYSQVPSGVAAFGKNIIRRTMTFKPCKKINSVSAVRRPRVSARPRATNRMTSKQDRYPGASNDFERKHKWGDRWQHKKDQDALEGLHRISFWFG